MLMLLMHQELANKEDPNGDENIGLVMAAVIWSSWYNLHLRSE